MVHREIKDAFLELTSERKKMRKIKLYNNYREL